MFTASADCQRFTQEKTSCKINSVRKFVLSLEQRWDLTKYKFFVTVLEVIFQISVLEYFFF